MYTAEEIRNITFTKSLGGYKTAEVDDFIDVCADTVEELNKANDELKRKMELLANKVVEYRNDEDSIRTALLSAQRMGDTVLREANHKAGLILDDAKIKAEKIEEVAKQDIKEQIDELERLKKLVSDFKTQMLGVYREHLSMINVLPDYKKPVEESEETAAQEEVPAAEPTAEAAPETAPVQPETVTEDEPVAAPETAEPEQAEHADEVADTESTPLFSYVTAADDQTDTTSRYADLKFGTDYGIEDDVDDEEEETGKRFHRKHKK